MTFVVAALAFARTHWKLVFGGLALLGLVIWLAIARHDAADWQRAAEAADHARTALEQRNRVTIASLDQCQVHLDAKNAETEQRAAELQAARVADARNVAAADARAAADRGRLATLEAIARRPANAACPLSDDLRAAMEGL